MCCFFGLLVIILDPKVTFTEREASELKKRSDEYKDLLGIDVRFCKACEQTIVFRSIHLGMGGNFVLMKEKCVAKYEFYSAILNTAIGARNILSMMFFNFFMMTLLYRILSISVETVDSKGMDKLPSFNTFRLYGVGIYGFIHSLKEFVACLVSVLTGTTVYERMLDLDVPYFKSVMGPMNYFDKVDKE